MADQADDILDATLSEAFLHAAEQAFSCLADPKRLDPAVRYQVVNANVLAIRLAAFERAKNADNIEAQRAYILDVAKNDSDLSRYVQTMDNKEVSAMFSLVYPRLKASMVQSLIDATHSSSIDPVKELIPFQDNLLRQAGLMMVGGPLSVGRVVLDPEQPFSPPVTFVLPDELAKRVKAECGPQR